MARRKDEIGALARSLDVFRDASAANKRLEKEAEEHRLTAEADRLAAQEKAEADAAERLRIATSGRGERLKRLAPATSPSASTAASHRIRGTSKGLQRNPSVNWAKHWTPSAMRRLHRSGQ